MFEFLDKYIVPLVKWWFKTVIGFSAVIGILAIIFIVWLFK